MGRRWSVIFGLALTALAGPALVDAVRAVPVLPVMDALRSGSAVSDLERSRAAALLSPLTSARPLADRAALLPPDRADEAEAAAVGALRRRPLDAHTWLRLAHLRHARGASAADVGRAVVASMAAAPTHRPLLFARLPVAATAWSGITPDERERVLAQTALAWEMDPARVRSLLAFPDGVALLRRLFARTQAREAPPGAEPPPEFEG